MTERPAFVLGVSGATWDVMGPMIAAGKLPHVERLCRSGVRGTLASVRAPGDKHFRPQTAWPSLATGCRPEHHGVTRFFHTAADLVRPTIWRLLSDTGRSVGLFGWPMTWPPSPINGFDVPCHHARDGSTWPPELAVRQASAREVRLHGAVRGVRSLARHGALWPLAPHLGRAARRLVVERDPLRRSLILGHLKQEAAFQLFLAFRERRRPSVSTFVTFIADWISHRYWRYHEPALFPGTDATDARALGAAVEDAYRAVDGFLGRVVSSLPEDAVVALVSEHGMAPETTPAEIGPWQYTINGPSLRELVGLPATVDMRPIARWLAIRPQNGRALPADCADRIRAVCVAETGHSLFQVYEHRNEVIVKYDLGRAVNGTGSNLERLRLRWNARDVAFLDVAVRANPQRSAMHAESGVLILSGPTIRRNEEIQGASIIDFAPTLLQAIGTTFPDVPFDGQPLDVFTRN